MLHPEKSCEEVSKEQAMHDVEGKMLLGRWICKQKHHPQQQGNRGTVQAGWGTPGMCGSSTISWEQEGWETRLWHVTKTEARSDGEDRISMDKVKGHRPRWGWAESTFHQRSKRWTRSSHALKDVPFQIRKGAKGHGLLWDGGGKRQGQEHSEKLSKRKWKADGVYKGRLEAGKSQERRQDRGLSCADIYLFPFPLGCDSRKVIQGKPWDTRCVVHSRTCLLTIHPDFFPVPVTLENKDSGPGQNVCLWNHITLRAKFFNSPMERHMPREVKGLFWNQTEG